MAYVNVCRQSILFEGELVPCLAGGGRSPSCGRTAGSRSPTMGHAPMKRCRSQEANSTGESSTVSPMAGFSTAIRGNACSPRDGMKEYPLRLLDGMVQVDLASE